MLIVSAGMQKSGSAYIYNVINDMQIAAGNVDAREIKKKYHLEKTLKYHNNLAGRLFFPKLFKLIYISAKDGPFVVKTHSRPTISLRMMVKLGFAKVIYIYRDPRDCLLSAIDHGKRLLENKETRTFAKMVDFEDAFRVVKRWIKTWERYSKLRDILMVRYEDLLNEPNDTTRRIMKYLGILLDQETVNKVILTYDRTNIRENERGFLHFNKALSFRYRTEMCDEHKKRFERELGAIIKQMGYELD